MGELFEYLYPTIVITGNLAFMPQIVKLYREQGRAEGISLESWLLWLVNSFITFGYAYYSLMDMRFALVSGTGFVLNAIVCALIVYHRYIKAVPMVYGRTEEV